MSRDKLIREKTETICRHPCTVRGDNEDVHSGRLIAFEVDLFPASDERHSYTYTYLEETLLHLVTESTSDENVERDVERPVAELDR